MNSRRIVATTRWILSVVVLAGILFVYHELLHVNPTTVALTLLLYILILASWSLRTAIVLSLIATVSYNYFFLPPVGTLTVSDPENWLALFSFLATAVIGSRLSQRARDEAEEARARQRELETLFALSREMLGIDNVSELVETVPRALVAATHARLAVLYLLEADRMHQSGSERIAEVERPHLRQQAQEMNTGEVIGDERRVPLKVGVKPRGLFLLRGGVSLSAGALEAIGGIISVSLDRATALEEVARGEATKESERLRTLMIDSITHELRTPLTSIKGASSTLLDGQVQSDEDRRELLMIIDEESDRVNKLISQAVEMAQLDARQVQMKFEEIDVESVIRDALQDCSQVEERNPMEMRLAQNATIVADLVMLKKVVCNLLENASKYSEPGKPIVVTTTVADDGVTVSVADQGVGIDSMEQSLIFDRFYRAPIHNQKIAGTGMGLSISKAIIDAHGGVIRVVSKQGEGSVFSFTLPLAGTEKEDR